MNPVELPKDGFWIYLIFNQVNGKSYVGKTKRPYHRCHQYIYDFKQRNLGHLNEHLFNAMHKHGIDNFDFRLIEKCDNAENLAERELYWIDQLGTISREKGYNLRRDSRSGMITHPETSARISSNLRIQWQSGIRNDHAGKMRESWNNDPLRRERQAKSLKRCKTKWKYIVSSTLDSLPAICDYNQLRTRGLGSALSSFHRSSANVVVVKGVLISRFPACQN